MSLWGLCFAYLCIYLPGAYTGLAPSIPGTNSPRGGANQIYNPFCCQTYIDSLVFSRNAFFFLLKIPFPLSFHYPSLCTQMVLVLHTQESLRALQCSKGFHNS